MVLDELIKERNRLQEELTDMFKEAEKKESRLKSIINQIERINISNGV